MEYAELYEKRMWWKSLLLFAALLGSAFVSLDLFANSPLLGELIEDLALMLLAVCFFGKQLLAALRDLFRGNRRRHLNRLFFLFLLFVTVFLANNILLSSLLSSIFVNNQHEAELDAVVMTASPFLVFLCSSLFAPVLEEIIFRFGLFRLFNLWNRWAAHILCALLFAFLHIWQFLLIDHDWIQLVVMLPYCVMGLCMSVLYEKTENLCFPVFLHMLLNGVGIVFSHRAV